MAKIRAPLVEVDPAVYEQLKKVRASKTVSLKPTPLLRSRFKNAKNEEVDFKLRYYQVQGVFHLLTQRRMILGDGTGLGKTIEVIAALCYLYLKEPTNKVIVVTPKSALRQWGNEILRFTTGLQPIVVSGTFEQRKAAYEQFAAAPSGPDDPKVILLVNYHILVRDWGFGACQPLLPNGRPDIKKPFSPGYLDNLLASVKSIVTIFDEATAFKNPITKTHEVCKFLSQRSVRCYGLTATLLKNNLVEGFAIYQVIVPGLFTTKTAFYDAYTNYKLEKMPGGRRAMIIYGYKNLDGFRLKIDPFFLGRPKHAVTDELPKISTKEIICELTPAESAKYAEALEGVLMLGDGVLKDYSATKTLSSLIYCQQIANSLHLLKFKEGDDLNGDGAYFDDGPTFKVGQMSAKEAMLVDLLQEELEGEKVIVYTRFEKHVDRLQTLLKDINVKSVRVTGAENDKKRDQAMTQFQDFDSDVKVIFITDAGSEAINLQSASAMVFVEAPWSWGNYVQLLGRPVRIGSIHSNVVVYHLIAERPGKTKKARNTIDHYTIETLHSKKDLVDKVLGESAVGALEFESEGNAALDLLRRMRSD